MILYLDTSALIKRYVTEPGADLVAQAIARAEVVGSSVVCRAEMAAALAKAVRMNALPAASAAAALRVFRSEWPRLVRVQASEAVIAQADSLAWELGLRGYDAVHLASALRLRDALGVDIAFATFDRRLWQAAGEQGLAGFPDDLPAFFDRWQQHPSGS